MLRWILGVYLLCFHYSCTEHSRSFCSRKVVRRLEHRGILVYIVSVGGQGFVSFHDWCGVLAMSE